LYIIVGFRRGRGRKKRTTPRFIIDYSARSAVEKGKRGHTRKRKKAGGIIRRGMVIHRFPGKRGRRGGAVAVSFLPALKQKGRGGSKGKGSSKVSTFLHRESQKKERGEQKSWLHRYPTIPFY